MGFQWVLESKNSIIHCHLLYFSGKTVDKQGSWDRLSEYGLGAIRPLLHPLPSNLTKTCVRHVQKAWRCGVVQRSVSTFLLPSCLHIYDNRLLILKGGTDWSSCLQTAGRCILPITLPPAFHTHSQGHLDPGGSGHMGIVRSLLTVRCTRPSISQKKRGPFLSGVSLCSKQPEAAEQLERVLSPLCHGLAG